MASRWALIASFALALFMAGDVRAEEEAEATEVPSTAWDAKHEPIEGRPGEYRTTELDTYIRLTPYLGALIFDGGAYMSAGPVFGVALEFEPADLMLISVEFATNHPWALRDSNSNGSSRGNWLTEGSEREFTEGRNGTDGDQDLEGHLLHPAIYIGLKNPELKLGMIQPIIGLGFGAILLNDYEGTLPVAGGGGLVDVAVKNSRIYHATIFLRFDIDISTHVKFGVNLKNHILSYATEEFLGNMEPEEFSLDNLHYAFEPVIYFSIAF